MDVNCLQVKNEMASHINLLVEVTTNGFSWIANLFLRNYIYLYFINNYTDFYAMSTMHMLNNLLIYTSIPFLHC